jgi:hypothetical protein
MKLRGFAESDWRVFRERREVGLERFCDEFLDEVEGSVLLARSGRAG